MHKGGIIMKKHLIALVSVTLILISAISIWYYTTSMSIEGCEKYCLEHTARKATSFKMQFDNKFVKHYCYFIAENGDSNMSQEIFIFRPKYFGAVDLHRYQFITSNTVSTPATGKNSAGSIQFFMLNDDGEKENTSTLLFFGSSAESDISRYEYTMTVSEGSAVYKDNVRHTDGVWMVSFSGISNTDEASKKLINNVKFYDAKNNLICSFK